MFSFVGNTSNVVTSPAFNLPMVLESFSIVNKTYGNITFNVYKIIGGNLFSISPFNQSLAASEMYEGTRQIAILATEQIKIQCTGSLDYDFTLNNMTENEWSNS